ncbi:MAG: aminotransferase class I/II-fold pyridoxal phosphate-dependent enzyme [Candidatus Obscuribacterales bacterium]|nr:aminotransferase class I/II-fold pyridoxal phosphate-dependent enzyme [Candidatus Obscuribacterales bacterium]
MSISPEIRRRISQKASTFTESVIREMSRMAAQYKCVNLAQGMPDFASPMELKEAACQALMADVNQYAITWGDKLFRDGISAKNEKYLGVKYEPETEITVTCGATEGMIATMLALVDPEDEVIAFEPYYENYGPDAILAGAKPRYVSLQAPNWTFDEAELEKAFSNKTRAIVLNTPHNPTGKVFSREELECIARLCQKWGVYAFTDEPYEHILFDGAKHVSIASLPGMKDLTVTVNSLSKTYSVTGWRLGTVCAPEELSLAIRKVHDFLTVGAAAPLQRAGAHAMSLPDSYYTELATSYQKRRDHMLTILDEVGIPYYTPQGAYYVFCDISKFAFENDVKFTEFLVKKVGVAVVPGSSFFRPGDRGNKYIRFCFAKKEETLNAARERLLTLHDKLKEQQKT